VKHLRTALFALVLFAIGARLARADCGPGPCRGLLCSSAVTIVIGTIQPEPTEPFGWALIVESVLLVKPGATPPKQGDRLSSCSGTTVTSGPVVGYYEGPDQRIPIGVFPVGADGNVHCRGWSEGTSAPEGTGVTPQRLAELVALADPKACRAQLDAAGYPAGAPCDDTGGPLECALGQGRRQGALTWLSIGVLVTLAAARLGRQRRAQRQELSDARQ